MSVDHSTLTQFHLANPRSKSTPKKLTIPDKSTHPDQDINVLVWTSQKKLSKTVSKQLLLDRDDAQKCGSVKHRIESGKHSSEDNLKFRNALMSFTQPLPKFTPNDQKKSNRDKSTPMNIKLHKDGHITKSTSQSLEDDKNIISGNQSVSCKQEKLSDPCTKSPNMSNTKSTPVKFACQDKLSLDKPSKDMDTKKAGGTTPESTPKADEKPPKIEPSQEDDNKQDTESLPGGKTKKIPPKNTGLIIPNGIQPKFSRVNTITNIIATELKITINLNILRYMIYHQWFYSFIKNR